jgi:dolichol-phosphate mannosyltransferase
MTHKIAVVLSCCKSKRHVFDVVARIGPGAFLIVAVDGDCPLGTGSYIKQGCTDPRAMVVVRNRTNLGGAAIHGYPIALERGAECPRA